MNEDIVCLLQDLGQDMSVDVIANFMLRNPELEDRIAARMVSLLSSESVNPSASLTANREGDSTNRIPESVLAFANMNESSNKMIFVVNMELGMGRGKQCAQVAHAALGLYLQVQQSGKSADQTRLAQWIADGQKKIVVKGNNLAHIRTIQILADEANLPNILIADAGCTQIAPGSRTVLAVFGSDEALASVTGSLKLL